MLVPVGGGGLIGGIASWFAGTVRVIGVEPDGAPTLTRARAQGEPADAPAGSVAADALAPRRVGELVFPITQSFVADVVLVDDASILAAQQALWQALRIAAEPAACVGIAALLSAAYKPAPGEHVAVVISGANMAPSQLGLFTRSDRDQARANLSVPIQQEQARIESGPLPVVRAEAALLTTVFQNLLGNALKFRGEDDPWVSVAAQRDGEFWEFSVTDNGIGVPPEYADRIFVIFQRLHDRQAYPGTGIGLALCRKIIEYHGGRMWLDTGHSPGARFCFTLPIPPESEDADDR